LEPLEMRRCRGGCGCCGCVIIIADAAAAVSCDRSASPAVAARRAVRYRRPPEADPTTRRSHAALGEGVVAPAVRPAEPLDAAAFNKKAVVCEWAEGALLLRNG
jgi:hypothetical protein